MSTQFTAEELTPEVVAAYKESRRYFIENCMTRDGGGVIFPFITALAQIPTTKDWRPSGGELLVHYPLEYRAEGVTGHVVLDVEKFRLAPRVTLPSGRFMYLVKCPNPTIEIPFENGTILTNIPVEIPLL